MPMFRYKAVAPTGETLSGQMEAASREEVVSRLQDGGNLPIEAIEAGAAGGLSFDLFRRSEMTSERIAAFTQQLGTLLGAGQPLDRALHLLTDAESEGASEDDAVRRLIVRIRDAVRGGSTLSSALEQQHGVFSRLYVNMVRAGEVSGSLTDTLKRLADYLERSRQLKATIINALIYPMILVGMVILAMVVLMIFVIPNFEPIFDQLGDRLPWITKLVLAIAGFLQSFWWLLLGGLIGAIWWFQRELAEPQKRVTWDGRFLEWGRIGDLVRKVETARLSRTLGTLLVNGVPLLTGLSIARNVMGNRVLADAVEQATNSVKTGSGLAFALGSTKRFPRLALQMIAVGEEAGALDQMSAKVAEFYEAEVDNAVDSMSSLLEPLIMAILGVLVGGLVIAMYLPIFKLGAVV